MGGRQGALLAKLGPLVVARGAHCQCGSAEKNPCMANGARRLSLFQRGMHALLHAACKT